MWQETQYKESIYIQFYKYAALNADILSEALQILMSTPVQQNEKILSNMYSVHLFYKQVLEELEKTLLSDKKERYLLNDWGDDKVNLFIHAVKYYLNDQPQFFNKSLEKYSNHQVQAILPLKRKKRKSSTINIAQVKLTSSHKSKKHKKEQPKGPGQQRQKEFNFDQCQTQMNQKLSEIMSQMYLNQQPQKVEQKGKKESSKAKKEEQDDFEDDLVKYQMQQYNFGYDRPYHSRGINDKNSQKAFSVKESSIYYQEEEQEVIEDSSEDEQSLGKFVQKALPKTNALIFGNYISKQLRHKTKQDKIELQLSNCFVKLAKYGRDAFYPRMTLNLFKQEIDDVNKPK